MSKGDTIHKIMSGLAASASLKMREMDLEGTLGKAFIVDLDLAPRAPREFRGQQRANCLSLRYPESCCDGGSQHHDSVGTWGLRAEDQRCSGTRCC